MALRLLFDRFPGAEVIGEPRARRAPADPPPRRATTPSCYLLPSAPPELVAAAYRTLSRLCHPDRGGSHERMVGLNAAVERLRDRGRVVVTAGRDRGAPGDPPG